MDKIFNSKHYPNSHEVCGDDGQPQIEVAFDDEGNIGAIFVYSPEIDSMVMVNLAAFEIRHKHQYMRLQDKVDNLVAEIADSRMEAM